MLKIDKISKFFFDGGNSIFFNSKKVEAVKNVSIEINTGDTLGIIGESGSGKSTLAKIIAGIHNPTKGDIIFKGKSLLNLSQRQRNNLIQYVFQDPSNSLNPRKTMMQSLLVPTTYLLGLTKDKAYARIKDILKSVSLPLETLNKYPHELSGGQAQRIAIARSLLSKSPLIVLDEPVSALDVIIQEQILLLLKSPLIVLDEPVSALDVIIQEQILLLLKNLKKEFNLSYIFISHDLAVVENFCNKIAVMFHGEFVEIGNTKKIINEPAHEYTKLLINSVP